MKLFLTDEDRAAERMRSAVHEAGHVIAAEALGMAVSGAILWSSTEGQVRHGPRPWPDNDPAWRDEDERDQMVIGLAGEAALSIFGDPDPGRGAHVDIADVRASAMTLAQRDRAAADELEDEAYTRADEMLRRHWSVLVDFAATLAEKGRLAASEVTDLTPGVWRASLSTSPVSSPLAPHPLAQPIHFAEARSVAPKLVEVDPSKLGVYLSAWSSRR